MGPALADNSRVMQTRQSSILKLELPIVVRIGERMMPVRDLLNLGPGSVIDLNKSVEDDLELLVNGKLVAAGKAVKVGENVGVRIAQVGDRGSRLRAAESTEMQA